MKTNTKEREEIKLELDDIFEEMESYVETGSNKLYADELFDRVWNWIEKTIQTVREETLEEVKKELPPREDGRTGYDEVAYGIKYGWNDYRAKVMYVLEKLKDQKET